MRTCAIRVCVGGDHVCFAYFSRKSFINTRDGAVTGSVSLLWQLGFDTTREFHKVPKFSIGGHSFSLCNALLKRQISCGQTLRCPFALCLPLFMLRFGLMCRREI